MSRPRYAAIALTLVLAATTTRLPIVRGQAAPTLQLHPMRTHADDLEIGGDLPNLAKGEHRFVAWADLDKLPQESATVSDDSNFTGTAKITGIPLEKLPALLGASPNATMLIVVCDDAYEAHYPAAYLKAHHPLLVLRINGQSPASWPVGTDGSAMGSYMVSHAKFTPSFKILTHTDEPQVPWGIVRLDLRREADVYAPITPRGPHANDEPVQQGFTIAKQNCFRCHAQDGEGGKKSDRTWQMVARRAVKDPTYFDALIRDPATVDPGSQMAASPQYDDATMKSLRAYFATFIEAKP